MYVHCDGDRTKLSDIKIRSSHDHTFSPSCATARLDRLLRCFACLVFAWSLLVRILVGRMTMTTRKKAHHNITYHISFIPATYQDSTSTVPRCVACRATPKICNHLPFSSSVSQFGIAEIIKESEKSSTDGASPFLCFERRGRIYSFHRLLLIRFHKYLQFCR